MIDLTEHWGVLLALAYAAEMAYVLYERKANKASDEADGELADTLRLGLEGSAWSCRAQALFILRLLQHYHWIRQQGAEWPREWVR